MSPHSLTSRATLCRGFQIILVLEEMRHDSLQVHFAVPEQMIQPARMLKSSMAQLVGTLKGHSDKMSQLAKPWVQVGTIFFADSAIFP